MNKVNKAVFDTNTQCCDIMSNLIKKTMEKINVAKLLRHCPKGMKLDCTMYENVYFGKVSEDKSDVYPITVNIIDDKGNEHDMHLTKEGCWSPQLYAKCVIFPKGKTTWEGFVPPCKFKDSDIVYIKTKGYNHNEYVIIFNKIKNNYVYRYVCFAYQMLYTSKNVVCNLIDIEEIRIATEEERKKLFQAIKDNGYKWNAETKTLEKLSADKFDINTLVPFESRVLARDNVKEKWHPGIWGFYDDNSYNSYPYKLIGDISLYCIPYEGNEHLLGKTDDCDEYFKTWEKSN